MNYNEIEEDIREKVWNLTYGLATAHGVVRNFHGSSVSIVMHLRREVFHEL